MPSPKQRCVNGGMNLNIRKARLVGVLLVALAGMLLFSAFASASEFSADVVTTHSEGVMTGKIYVKNNMLRSELNVEDEVMVTIINLDEEVAWLMMPGNMYMEIFAPEDPSILESDEYEEVNLGVETVQGYVCDVIRFIYKEEFLGTSTQWMARKLGHPLRIEEADETGKVISVSEYSNIKEEALCDCLFELPEGYEKVDLFGIPGMLGMGESAGSTGVPGSAWPGDVSGGSGMPDMSGIPGFSGDLSGIPGMPGSEPGASKLSEADMRNLPREYQGTLSVLLTGEREWETLVGGIGEDSRTRHKETVREKVVVHAPLIDIDVGLAMSPAQVTVSFDYRMYEDDMVIERRQCEEQTMETEFIPCSVCYNSLFSYRGSIYVVRYGSLDMLGDICELSCYYSDGTKYHQEKTYYTGHGFSFDIPLPSGTDRLSGTKTARLEGVDDWITVEVSWDLRPVTGK
jgi:hypothetical protein